jgi:hypothetical protein
MMTRWFKLGSAFSLMLTSTLMTACGSSDMYDPDASCRNPVSRSSIPPESPSIQT